MCSRFELDHTFEAVVLRFNITAKAQFESNFQSIKEVRPTDQMPVITNNNRVVYLSWGLKVDWNKNPIINARSETLTQKSTFQTMLKNRCLVPATAYYEWRKENNIKVKTRIHSQDQKLISFAGLFDENYFTIITCKPSPSISNIHDRMPVILNQTDETAWISEDNSFDKVAKFLRPSQDTSLRSEEILKPLNTTNTQEDLFD